jgi:membrane-bound lytic murein transglycosylase A
VILSRRRAVWIGAGLGLILLIGAIVAWLLRPAPPPRLTLTPAKYDDLAGWTVDDAAAALPAFLRSCDRFLKRPDDAPLDRRRHQTDFGLVGEWRPVCAAAAAVKPGDTEAARAFFAHDFAPFLAGNNGSSDGLFTGYFEISLHGARRHGGIYQIPLYRRPPDPKRYTRAEIEDGALSGKGLELVWVDSPIDAFFLEIQGSGVVELEGGGRIRVGYDGSNGKPYVSVGRLLIERGVLPRRKVTMAAIRDWMKAHPKEGAALRRDNSSYVFFRELSTAGPLGAGRVVLTPGRSLAVDRHFIALGVPVWLDAKQRFTTGSIRRLVVAQDTGGAIRGPVRGDLFWGRGAAAASGAGAMNARGRYYLLLPNAVAARLAPTS